MELIDKRFVLVAQNGDRLYPYKKSQKETGRYGFALSKPGEQDRHGKGTYTDSIVEVIQRLIFDGWGVRATTTDKVGRQRKGSVGINKRTIKSYEISPELEHLVKQHTQSSHSTYSSQSKHSTDNNLTIQNQESPKENPVDETTYRAIKTRRGQPQFRTALLQIFDGKCCISECTIESVLEAAHIVPHAEENDYSVANGILLRADIHTLYDLNLIGIDGSGIVHVSNSLQESEYWQFNGKPIIEHIEEKMSSNLGRRFSGYANGN